MSSRNLKPEELAQGLSTRLIARDAIAIIVHPANAVTDLTLEQVAGIFSGEITNWQELGGEDRPIVVVTREEGSGTRGAFEELVMGERHIVLSALREDSNGAVRVIVAGDRYGVGYISLGLVNDRVRAVHLDGVLASVEHVHDGTYGLSRPFLFLWTGELPAASRSFLDYVLSDVGQALLAHEGLVTGGE
jgi:phosphate transport system substrate-binding protein